MSGQFAVFTFMGPLLAKLTGVGPDAVGLVFAIYGLCGFIGIAIVTRIVDSWGAYKTSVMCIALVLTGITGWALSAGVYPLMAFSVAIWAWGLLRPTRCSRFGWSARARAGVGIGVVAQYVGTLRGPGHWFCDRRTIVCARSLLRHRLCRHGLCRHGAYHGGFHARPCDSANPGRLIRISTGC